MSTSFSGFELKIIDLCIWVPETKTKECKPIIKGISTDISKG